MPELVVQGYVSGVRNQIGQYIQRGLRASRETVGEEGLHGVTAAQGYAPFRSGELVGSIGWRWTGAYEGIVEATADHAAPQEEGAGAHLIGAPGQWLSNINDGAQHGWPLFSRQGPVMHPGNPATRFMSKALTEIEHSLSATLRRNWPQ